MRKLLWFTVGFAAVAFGTGYIPQWLCLPLVILSVLLAALLGLFCRRYKTLFAAVLVLLGCGAGLLRIWDYTSGVLSAARQYDGVERNITIEITDFSDRTDYGTTALGEVRLDGEQFLIRVYLSGNARLYPGYTVSGTMKLYATPGGGLKESARHSSEGVYLLAYDGDDTIVQTTDGDERKYFAVFLRDEILQMIDRFFPEDTRAFAGALLLGESDRLSYGEDSAYRISGIRHVVAVSGLHVAILFSVVYVFSWKNRFFTAAIGIPVLILFAAVAGFTPSVMRACIMQVLMMIALLFKREYDPPTALAFAVLVILFINPMTVMSVGFQLSVSCCVGIFLFSRRIYSRLVGGRLKKHILGKSLKARCLRWSMASISVSLSTMITTTPLCAIYFGAISLVGVLTNLLTMWLISFVFYMIMAVCIVGMWNASLAYGIALVVSWAIRYVQLVADILAGFPVSAVYTKSAYIVVWLVFSYGLLSVALLTGKIRKRTCGLIATVSLLLAVWNSWLEPNLGSLQVTVIDVGQGQSVLLTWENKSYLVDCGGDSDKYAANTVQQTLASMGIFYLDGLIVTHYDRDHAGGVALLLQRVPANKLYLPQIQDGGNVKEQLTQNYAQIIQWVEEDTVFSDGEGVLTLIPGNDPESENESSMCVLFQRENYDILVAGDRGEEGEAALMEQIQLPKLDLLVVGHHGSNTSSSMPFLLATMPETAVVSTGQSTRYLRPSQRILRRFEAIDCPVFSTAANGTIIFRG